MPDRNCESWHHRLGCRHASEAGADRSECGRAAQDGEGASIFWIRRMAAIGGEHAALEYWQTKRDRTKRGIVEVTGDDSE